MGFSCGVQFVGGKKGWVGRNADYKGGMLITWAMTLGLVPRKIAARHASQVESHDSMHAPTFFMQR